ncbi:TPA: protein rep, partial [Vibrio parahaemolyticus]|nr:protein rep [Vibrio parahaemolyticus]
MCNSSHLNESVTRENQGVSRLGIPAKSTAPLEREKVQENRRKRYKFQAVAAKVLAIDAQEKMQKSGKKHAGDIHRVCDCSWTALASNVELMRSKEHGTGHVKNIVTCGSVWSCPICTGRIQERRREEIAKAMQAWYSQGGQVIMVTLTAPHYNHQSLKQLRAMQSEALTHLRQSGAYKRMLVEEQGFKGLIRALEVTVSKRNGWHLHTHELWFVKGDANIKRIKKRTLERWENACLRSGLLNAFDDKQVAAFRRRSVDIKGNASCSEYLAKMDETKHWGADREIAKQSTKQGKKSGFHPFGLLDEIEQNGKDAMWAQCRFIEYANGMKGARQLFWSHGLKDYFEINEKSDEQLATEDTDTLERVKTIHKTVWYRIAQSGARSTLLEVIELCDSQALEIYLKQFNEV